MKMKQPSDRDGCFVKLLLSIVSYSCIPLIKGWEKQKGQYRQALAVLPHLYIKID